MRKYTIDLGRGAISAWDAIRLFIKCLRKYCQIIMDFMTKLIFHKITRLIVILKIIVIRHWIMHCKILRRKKTDVKFLVLLKTLVLMVSFLQTYLHFLTGFFTLFFPSQSLCDLRSKKRRLDEYSATFPIISVYCHVKN